MTTKPTAKTNSTHAPSGDHKPMITRAVQRILTGASRRLSNVALYGSNHGATFAYAQIKLDADSPPCIQLDLGASSTRTQAESRTACFNMSTTGNAKGIRRARRQAPLFEETRCANSGADKLMGTTKKFRIIHTGSATSGPRPVDATDFNESTHGRGVTGNLLPNTGN